MKKRFSFISIIVASLLVAGTFLPTTAYAQGANGPLSENNVTQSIWSGLRQGITTALGQTVSPPAPNPTPPPNPPQPTPPTGDGAYVALGDSVAAGLGLPVDNQSSQPAQCGRSNEAYASQIAAARGLTVTNVACSGATAGDLFTSQEVDGPNIPPQLLQAFANGTPELMTLTAGANDAHWARFMQKCLAKTCGTTTDSAITRAYLAALKVKLHYAFNSIRYRSHGQPPTVVITGYYNPISVQCSSLEPRLTPGEIAWFSDQVAAINQTLQSVSAQYSFVRFAPVDFTGHDLCSADPWLQGLQDPAPIHPNAAGQTAIANAVLSRL